MAAEAPMTSSASATINLGSRSSALALVQSDLIVNLLHAAHPNYKFPVQTVLVRGDADKISPFLQMADSSGRPDAAKNLWTEEMEIMLGAGQLDMLVHSLKDLPTVLPKGCMLGGVALRDDPRDALCIRQGLQYKTLDDLPAGSVVGTSSTRRKALLKRGWPQLVVRECRGNVPTRLNKLDAEDGNFTCIIVATAGLNRLNLQDRITSHLDPNIFPYAVGQGALGVEIRTDDTRIIDLLSPVENNAARWPCLAEREMLRTLQGGCSSPVGVWSLVEEDDGKDDEKTSRLVIRLTGRVIHPDGQTEVSSSASMAVKNDDDAGKLGEKVAMQLLAEGADNILAQIRLLTPSTNMTELKNPVKGGMAENKEYTVQNP